MIVEHDLNQFPFFDDEPDSTPLDDPRKLIVQCNPLTRCAASGEASHALLYPTALGRESTGKLGEEPKKCPGSGSAWSLCELTFVTGAMGLPLLPAAPAIGH
jgi:hypothetical protein